jgi:hypothetical protein
MKDHVSDGENYDYNPARDHFPHLFLTLLIICSALSSFCVVIDIIFRVGLKSAASRLVLLINIAAAICIIARIPFYLIPLCRLTEPLFWYFYFQILLICLFLLDFSRKFISLMISSSGSFDSADLYKLESSKLVSVFLGPLIAFVLSCSVKYYDSNELWCGMDRHKAVGQAMYGLFFIVTWAILVLAVIMIFEVLNKARTCNNPELFEVIKKRVIYGNAMYGMVTTVIGLLMSIVGTFTAARSQKDRDDYWCYYVSLLIFSLSGYVYAAIYIRLKPQLQVN